MNIERLKELKDYMDKCLYHATNEEPWENSYKNVESHKTVIALIDSEIARQSMTDEDVKRAIEYFRSDFDYQTGCDCGVCEKAKPFFDLAITALQQMRTEGCTWCRNHTDMTVDGYANGIGTDVCLDVISFCPVCGKDLR